ncbi:kinase-like domain-containing protein [Helicostylum pulchrum]|nr:kinase-like domain-containing protein [Helicostylum pulchrum]
MSSSPVCGGDFQNGVYRFDQDAKVYQYNNSTLLVDENTSLNIRNDTDLVTLIIKCVYNGADTIYFIGTTKNEAKVSLYSAALNSTNNSFNFQKIVDPTNGVLEAESTMLFSVDKWPDCKRCAMLQYNNSSIGITGSNSFSPNINKNNAYNISSVKTSFTAQNGKMYQLLPQGLKSYMLDTKITTFPALYQFENPNMVVNSNIAWQTASNEDSSQILFYDSGSNFQLLKLDDQTSTAKMINNTYKDMKPNSIAFFQMSNLIIMDKESYRTIPVSQFSASIPPPSPPTLADNASSVTQSPKLDSRVAGGFTALGIVIGSGLTFLLYLLWKLCSRSKPGTGTRGIKTSRDSGTGLDPTSPIETVVVPQVPVVYRPIHQQFAKQQSMRPILIDSRVGEGDPASDITVILNKKCLVNSKEVGVVSINNPLHHQEVYIRKCRYGDSHVPALIHYFRNNSEGDRKFNRAVDVLAALEGQNTENIIKFIDAVQLKLTTNADRGFKYMLITSYYEPGQSLASLYEQALSGDTVVDVNDETFMVWTIYSMLLAVRDLHRAGFVHRFITADCFYAKSYSPTTDWCLADFDESGIAGEPYRMPADRCEYYDSTFNSTTFHYEADIWAVGRVIYKVVSGGRQFQTYSSNDYSDCIEEQVHGKVYGRHYRDLLKSTLCNTRYEQRITADQLVELWETRFDFKGI